MNQSEVELLKRIDALQAKCNHLHELWHHVNGIMEDEGIPDANDLAHLCNLSKLAEQDLSVQEREDLGAAASTQYAANTIREMVKVIADEDFNKQEVLSYAQSIEDR